MFSDTGADGESGLRRTLHSHDIFCTDDSDQFVIRSLKIIACYRSFSCYYPFLTDYNIFITLGSMFTSGVYA